MRTFVLVRDRDETGISGVGQVAEGVLFASGKVVLNWHVPHRPQSIVVYDSIDDVLVIHGHEGATRLEWTPAGW